MVTVKCLFPIIIDTKGHAMNLCTRIRVSNKANGIICNKSVLYTCCNTLVTRSKEETICNKAVNEAEKVVGYPTSFLSLRWLLNDEISNISTHIRKLIGTNHPLLATARDLIINRQSPTWGLIVLLVSKAGGLKKEYGNIDQDITAGILHSQRVLAEVTEMVRTSNMIHKSILNIDKTETNDSNLNYGNKLSLLAGDYLLSSSFRELANLKNHEVNELVSTCLRDLVEAEFIEPRDKQNHPLPARPLEVQTAVTVPNLFGTEPFKIKEVLGNAKSEWTLRHFLGNASLLAKSCQGTLALAEHSKEMQQAGYLFGRNMALTWQAKKDMEIFTSGSAGDFSLICAPLMFHLQYEPSLYDFLMEDVDLNKVDFEEIRQMVKSGPGLEKTRELKKELTENCFIALERFPDSEAKTALMNIVNVL